MSVKDEKDQSGYRDPLANSQVVAEAKQRSHVQAVASLARDAEALPLSTLETYVLLTELEETLRWLTSFRDVHKEQVVFNDTKYIQVTGALLVSVCVVEGDVTHEDGTRIVVLLLKHGFLGQPDNNTTPPRLTKVDCVSPDLDEPFLVVNSGDGTVVNGVMLAPVGLPPRRASPPDIIVDLLSRMIDIYIEGTHTAEKSARVRCSESFRHLIVDTHHLRNIDLLEMTAGVKKAFFINCYNLLSMFANLSTDGCTTSRTRDTFFNVTKLHIGGSDYSLNDMQHGILRGNQKAPRLGVLFTNKDPRYRHVVVPDPRVHFALCTGTKSSPALDVYDFRMLDLQLDEACSRYLIQHVTVDNAHTRVFLPPQFKWFRTDFANNDDSILHWISKYVHPLNARLISTFIGASYSLSYIKFMWAWCYNVIPIVYDETAESNDSVSRSSSMRKLGLVELTKRQAIRNVTVEYSDTEPHAALQNVVSMLGAEYDRRIARLSNQMVALALLAMVLLIALFEVSWSVDGSFSARDSKTTIVRALISVVSVLLVWRLVVYYRYMSIVEQKRFGFKSTAYRRRRRFVFILELLICAIHPPPFLDFDVDFFTGDRSPLIPHKLGMFMFFRLYLLGRTFRNNSQLYKHRKDFVLKRGGDAVNVLEMSSFTLTMKYLFNTHPIELLASVYTLVVLFVSYSAYISERDRPAQTTSLVISNNINGTSSVVNGTIFSPSNSLWYSLATVNTVGYGDLQAVTLSGRVTSFFGGLIGVIWQSSVIVALYKLLTPTKYQKYALKRLEETEFDKSIREAASIVIQTRWRYALFLRKAESFPAAHRRKLNSMFLIKRSLASSRFDKLLADKKSGGKTDHLIDFSRLHILKRVQQTERHIEADFAWLSRRLDTMSSLLKRQRGDDKLDWSAAAKLHNVLGTGKLPRGGRSTGNLDRLTAGNIRNGASAYSLQRHTDASVVSARSRPRSAGPASGALGDSNAGSELEREQGPPAGLVSSDQPASSTEVPNRHLLGFGTVKPRPRLLSASSSSHGPRLRKVHSTYSDAIFRDYNDSSLPDDDRLPTLSLSVKTPSTSSRSRPVSTEPHVNPRQGHLGPAPGKDDSNNRKNPHGGDGEGDDGNNGPSLKVAQGLSSHTPNAGRPAGYADGSGFEAAPTLTRRAKHYPRKAAHEASSLNVLSVTPVIADHLSRIANELNRLGRKLTILERDLDVADMSSDDDEDVYPYEEPVGS